MSEAITLHDYVTQMYGYALENCDDNQFRRVYNDLHKCLTAVLEAYRYHRLGEAKVQDGFTLTDATAAQQSYIDADYYYDMSREKTTESVSIQMEDSDKRGKQIKTADIADLDEIPQAIANQGTLVYFGVDSEIPVNPANKDNFETCAVSYGLSQIAEIHSVPIERLEPSLFTHHDNKWVLMAEQK